MIREKKIYSGRMLEADFYPVYENRRRLPERAAKNKITSEEQAEYNRQQSEKRFIRLVNCNFGTDDIFLHLTYAPENAPGNEDAARRDVNNYLRRVKYYFQKHKLGKLKYIYVIEQKVYRKGRFAGLVNWHCHLFITGGAFDRDTAEKMWKKGMANADRYQPDTFGPETAARYLCKDPQGRKRFVCSKNLKKPVEKHKDGKVGRKTVEKMAKIYAYDREYWERRYPGYDFINCIPRFNDYNSNWYVSVVMFRHKKEKKNNARRKRSDA